MIPKIQTRHEIYKTFKHSSLQNRITAITFITVTQRYIDCDVTWTDVEGLVVESLPQLPETRKRLDSSSNAWSLPLNTVAFHGWFANNNDHNRYYY